MKTLSTYVIELLQKRRRAPQDDFLSALNEAQDTEGQLTEDEIVWNVVNLLFAGQDTTRIQLAAAVRAFVENGIWDDLRADPSRIAQALDESLRFYPVLQFLVRKPLEAVELDGFRFPPGRRVVVNTTAASRDPKVFTDPHRFDPNRPSEYRVPFGWGIHYCLGHVLARTEMTEALTLLTSKLTGVRVGDVHVSSPTGMLGGPESLALEFSYR